MPFLSIVTTEERGGGLDFGGMWKREGEAVGADDLTYAGMC